MWLIKTKCFFSTTRYSRLFVAIVLLVLAACNSQTKSALAQAPTGDTLSKSLAEAAASQKDCPKQHKSIEEALKEPLYDRANAVCYFLWDKFGGDLGRAADECAKIIRSWKQVKRVDVHKDRNPIMVTVVYDLKTLVPADDPNVPPDSIEGAFAFPDNIPFYAYRPTPAYCK